MPVADKFQLGVKDEVTYGTAVTPDRFYEAYRSTIQPDHRRISSKNMRAGDRAQRSTRFVPYKAGASGEIGFEVLSKGFGWWLKHMLGGTATTGPTETTVYTHTGTVNTLKGDSFTLQDNRPLFPGDTDQAFTFEGGKILQWSLGCNVDGLLDFTAQCDFEDYATATALATASYPAGTVEPLAFVGATVTIGGSAWDYASSFKVTVDNRYDAELRRLRASGLKYEPQTNDMIQVQFELEGDFDALTQFNRFASATASGAGAQIVATFKAPTLLGSTIYPNVAITIPFARFDGFENGVDGPAHLMQKLKGVGLFDGTNSVITVAYQSGDTTA